MTPPATDEHAYLFAHTRLRDFLSSMTEDSLDCSRTPPVWPMNGGPRPRRFKELQQTEAGWADEPPVGNLPKSLEPLVRQVAADPIFKRSFSAVPGAVGMVELDRLVASQKSVNLTHVERVKEQLGPSPDLEAVFRACLPFDHPTPPYRIGRVATHSFVFASDSNDLRFLESILVRPEQLSDYQSSGPLAGVVGVAVGYGSNFLNAIACDRRLVLNNGFHRAYALRALGVTHVPCVVQRLTSRADLEFVGRAAIRRDADVLLRRAPPARDEGLLRPHPLPPRHPSPEDAPGPRDVHRRGTGCAVTVPRPRSISIRCHTIISCLATTNNNKRSRCRGW